MGFIWSTTFSQLVSWTSQKVKGGWKSLLTIFVKKLIPSGYSKSSNSSEFTPILQKYYEMICEIIVSTTMCGMFLIFCPLSFANSFMVKNNFSEPQNHLKLNISRPIYFKKYSYLKNPKKDLTQINWKDLFFRKKTFS